MQTIVTDPDATVDAEIHGIPDPTSLSPLPSVCLTANPHHRPSQQHTISPEASTLHACCTSWPITPPRHRARHRTMPCPLYTSSPLWWTLNSHERISGAL